MYVVTGFPFTHYVVCLVYLLACLAMGRGGQDDTEIKSIFSLTLLDEIHDGMNIELYYQ